MAKYRILSMDGGGIRGILTARLLDRIVAQRPDFLTKVDLFAGTSTGSILAIGLARGVVDPASGLTPARFVSLYQNQGGQIFHHDLLHDLGALWGLTRAKYGTENRKTVIHNALGDFSLNDLLPKKVLVATFQLDGENPTVPEPPNPTPNWKAKFFHNYPGTDSDGLENAVDVIMRSSAAPTYFPVYGGFVDGGVVANNPSVCALTQAINTKTGGNQAIQDVVLMSVGTGSRAKSLKTLNGDWGLQQWGFNLLDLIFESGSGLADYQCTQLLAGCYKRIDPDLKQDIGLDDVDAVTTLLQLANGVDLTSAFAWIDANW